MGWEVNIDSESADNQKFKFTYMCQSSFPNDVRQVHLTRSVQGFASYVDICESYTVRLSVKCGFIYVSVNDVALRSDSADAHMTCKECQPMTTKELNLLLVLPFK